MKKNLRIVSAAAAALLAVAPVAATAIATPATTVSAATVTNKEVAKTTVNSAEALNAKVMTSAEEAQARKALGVSNDISFKYVSADVKGNTATLTYNLQVKNGVNTAAFVKTADAQALKQIYLGGASASGFSIANNLVEAGTPAKALTVTVVRTLTKTTANTPLKDVKAGDQLVATGDIEGTHREHGKDVPFTIKKGDKLQVVSANATSAVVKVVRGDKTYTVTVPNKQDLFDNAEVAEPSASENITNNSSSTLYNDANVSVNLNAIAGLNKNGQPLLGTDAYGDFVQKGSVSGNVTATIDGKSYTGMISNGINGQNITFTDAEGKTVKASDLRTRTPYTATINSVSFNLGNAYSNKQVELTLPNGVKFADGDYTKKFTADVNGVVNTGKIVMSKVYALDPTDMKGISFYEVKTGNIVNSGSVSLNAVNGKVNIESVYASVLREYGAAQVFNDSGKQDFTARVAFLNNLRSQLEKQNIKVDPNGYFTAPSSFTINMTAKSQYNGAEATLPVTVNVPNATASNNAAETTKTVTIMHISTIYDKNGKATHEPALRAYDTYSVVATPVNLKDEKGKDAGMFYKLAGKDQYIKVGNVDGTKRSLKKNSYVYKSTGKAYMKSKKHHRVLKAGSSVTTYGKSFMIAGHQMYRIGRNQYVKKANF